MRGGQKSPDGESQADVVLRSWITPLFRGYAIELERAVD